jgi:hypothetical protein
MFKVFTIDAYHSCIVDVADDLKLMITEARELFKMGFPDTEVMVLDQDDNILWSGG